MKFLLALLVGGGLMAGPLTTDPASKGEGKFLEFKEVLRVGPSSHEHDDNYLWPGELINLEVDGDRIFISCPIDEHIIELKTNGDFVRKIGQRGQGPGEFQALRTIQRVPEGFKVFESLGGTTLISDFDANFAFQDRKQYQDLGKVMETMLYSPDGKRTFSQTLKVDQTSGTVKYFNRYLLMNDQFEEKVDLLTANPTGGFNPQRATEKAFWVEFLSERLRPVAQGEVCYGAFNSKGTFYSAVSHTYEISIWDTNFKKIGSFQKKPIKSYFTAGEKNQLIESMTDSLKEEIPPQMAEIVTPDVVRQAVEIAGFPVLKHPVRGLRITEDDHILVLTAGDQVEDTIVVEVFDPSGEFVGSFEHLESAMNRMIFRNGKAYTVYPNEDEDNEVVVYDIRWSKG